MLCHGLPAAETETDVPDYPPSEGAATGRFLELDARFPHTQTNKHTRALTSAENNQKSIFLFLPQNTEVPPAAGWGGG